MPRPARPVTYAAVLRDRTFAALFAAQVVSLLADRLAAVALTVLVHDRTGSSLLAGATYAATLLPWLLGGVLLSGVADRRSRRSVMVVSDLARAVLVALMLVPGAPLWVLLALLVGSGFFAPTFEAARAAALPALLGPEEYVRASALSLVAGQAAQLVGLALGGVLVHAVGAATALGLNAASFLLSAVVVALALAPGQGDAAPAGPRAPVRARALADAREGLALVFGDRVLGPLLLLAWLTAAALVAPEGLAVAVVQERGHDAAWTGALMAVVPAGMAVGAAVLGRLSAAARRRAMLPLVALAVLPLLLTPLVAGRPWLLAALWLVAGVGGAYQVPANALFMRSVPDAYRARAFGVAQSGMLALQGVVLLLVGLAGDAVGTDVAVAAWAGLLLLVLLRQAWTWPHDLLAAADTPGAPAPARQPAAAS